MNDIKLIKDASPGSLHIATIDSSWRTYLDDIKDNTLCLPFSGSYNAIIKHNYILVEGYYGELRIDKVCYQTMYSLKQPIIRKKFKLYGVYDRNKKFECFTSIPQIGVHYMSLNMRLELCPICTGELVYVTPNSLGILQECCRQLIKTLRIIYLESIGVSVILPNKQFQALKKILSNKSHSASEKLSALKNQKFIREML